MQGQPRLKRVAADPPLSLEQREYLNLIRTATKNSYKILGAVTVVKVEKTESET